MPKKKNIPKIVPGKILRDFVYSYRFLIRPYISRGNFEASAYRMNNACTDYQDFRINLSGKVPKGAYKAYQRTIILFSGLLDRSVFEVKADFANPEKRQTLLNALDNEVKTLDKLMRSSRDSDYLEKRVSFNEETAAS